MTEARPPSNSHLNPRQELRQLVRSELKILLEQKNWEGAKAILVPVQPADIAEAIEGLPEAMQALAFRLLVKDEAIAVYEYLAPSVQQVLLKDFNREDVRNIIEQMSPDDRVKLFDELPAKVVRQLLIQLSPSERQATALLLGYKPQTAGRIMTPEYLSLKEGWTVDRAFQHIRRLAPTKETIYSLYVTDARHCLTGSLSLRDLVTAQPEQIISEIAAPHVISVHTDTPQEEVARLLQRYDFLALPVVDSENRLVGIITVDDALDILEAETTKDIHTLGGVQPGDNHYFQSSTLLGRIEARVLPNLDAALATLGAVCHQDPHLLPHRPPLEAFFEGDRLLRQHTEEVFGKLPDHRRVRIMVTLPTEAADNYEFVRELIQRGTDCIRINCAHDTSAHWSKMIEHLRRAEVETGRSCKVFMDLGGPKPRLGKVLLPTSKQRLHQGDRLQLTRDLPTTPAKHTFQANCTIPEILSQLEVGTRVWIDDGKIGAKVESLLPEGVLLRITHARPKGEKLRPDKGINFPDSLLDLSPLTSKDRRDLDFVAAHADLIGYSFVQKATDIELLQLELKARLGVTWRTPAIIAKIETPEAVRNLPELTGL